MSDIRNYLEHPGNWGTLDGRPGLLRAMLDVLEAAHEADTAHAVALEREKVAVWFETEVKILHQITDTKIGRTTHRDEYRPATQLAQSIRNGDHWKGGE